MSIIYKEDGFDVSDDGHQTKKLVDNLEVQLAISKLSKKQQEIIQMIIGGFTFREITDELKISNRDILVAKRALRDKI